MLVCLVISACQSQPGETSETWLLDHEKWQPLHQADDPFAEHRPEQVDCSGFLPERENLEVHTSHCNYAGLGQPTLTALEPGDQIETALSYQALFPPPGVESAQAHVALIVGEDVVFEMDLDLPIDRHDYHPIAFTVDTSYPAGTPAVLHLHNHGSNVYNVLPVLRVTQLD